MFKIGNLKFGGLTLGLFISFLYNLILTLIVGNDPVGLKSGLLVISILSFLGMMISWSRDNRKKDYVGMLILLILPLPLIAQEIDPALITNEESPIFLILSGIGGIILHIYSKVRNRFSGGEGKNLTWARVMNEPDWVRHILHSGFAIILIVMLVLLKDYVDPIYPVTYVTIVAAGYQADSIWKNWSQFKERESDERDTII